MSNGERLASGAFDESLRSASLDPANWGALREQAHRMLDDMLGYLEDVRSQPVWQPIPEQVRGRFRAELPVEGTSLAAVHEEFMSAILPYTARNGHPGFMGWVQGGGTAVGMLAEMLAAGLNANVGGRDQVPLEVERQIKDWMRTLFGFPETAGGLFVTGSSMANLLAVVIARDARFGVDVRSKGVVDVADEAGKPQRLTAYASTAVHGCVARALDVSGLGSNALRFVRVDSRGRMDLSALESLMVRDRAAGFTPFLVIGTVGTVDIGAMDDLDGLAQICERERLWFHVDGALGAMAMLVPEFAPRLKGIERADSLAFDFHKWAQVPYDAGFLLVRDGRLQQAAFASPSAYLAREERGMSDGSPWPADMGVDLSRGFRALKTWATLKVYGTAALAEVVRHSCVLAQYLETRILEESELELLAPVELNIVCFRYRFEQPEEDADKLNRQIVVELQEAGRVAPSMTLVIGRVAIRAAIVNHRTHSADIEALVGETLRVGRALRSLVPVIAWQPWLERRDRVQELSRQLLQVDEDEAETALRLERAILLARMGKTGEARADHMRIVEVDPEHRANLLEFGRMLSVAGQKKAARIVYAEAVRHFPGDVVSRVNYGGQLLEADDAAGARVQYEAALTIDPDSIQAHGGMYYALSKLGEAEAAAVHQRKSFGRKSVFKAAYKGSGEPVQVVLLVASNGGNTPIEKLLDDRIFETYVVVADFYNERTPLPEHDLIVNGIGDCDQSEAALLAAERLTRRTSAAVINAPAAVQMTGRLGNANRLSMVPGLRTPITVMLSFAVLEAEPGAEMLATYGLKFPLLLRAPGFHMGQHFVRVESQEGLADCLADMPGKQVLAIEFLDARGTDGCVRKYRVMMVDGELYPLHLAISADWKIHYFSADMAERTDHQAEELRFLQDMAGVLGKKAMSALHEAQMILGLEYGGMDFGLNAEGEVLLFEANATMVVEQPDDDPKWDYRRAAVTRIHKAVREMLMRRIGVSA